MKIIFTIAILAVLSIMSLPTQAGGYMGADYSFINTDITDHTGINLKGGYAFNDFLAIEGRTLVSSSSEDWYGATVEIDSLYSLMLKVSLPVDDSVKVYGVFGTSRAEVTASYMGYSESVSNNSSSFGFGVAYELLEAYTFTAEYTQLFEDADMFSFGARLNF